MRRLWAVCALLLLLGCSGGEEPRAPEAGGAVLYTIGLSTDPYGNSEPRGFGVARGLASRALEKVEVHDRTLGEFGGARWIDDRRIVVPRAGPPLRRPLLFQYRDGSLERIGESEIRPGSSLAWSVDQRRLAYEPPVPCKAGQRALYDCYRASGDLFVARSDGSKSSRVGEGHLMGWTPDERLAFFRSYQRATPEALDPDTGEVGEVLPGWRGGLPIWSGDRRFVAGTYNALRVMRADGSVVQTIPSRIAISMYIWSPVGHRLAWTTSGSPDPHELFVLDKPAARPRLLYKTGADHFDWVTWSPDGKWLLLDEEHHDRWLLIRADGPRERRVLPRLGGRPLWCCPVTPWTQ